MEFAFAVRRGYIASNPMDALTVDDRPVKRVRDKAREWASSIRSALRELGLERERLAVDKVDTAGFLALQEEGIAITDVGPATVDAREVKTPEEAALFAINGGIGDAMLAEFEAAIRPGIRGATAKDCSPGWWPRARTRTRGSPRRTTRSSCPVISWASTPTRTATRAT